MSRFTRCTATATVAILAAALLAGCPSVQGVFDNGKDIYDWQKTRDFEAAAYEWIVVTNPESRAQLCGRDKNANAPIACAILVRDHVSGKPFCTVFSALTEEKAKVTYFYGSKWSLYEHEVWDQKKTVGHCAGMTHTDEVFNPITGKK